MAIAYEGCISSGIKNTAALLMVQPSIDRIGNFVTMSADAA